jgi:hypothetical protein
MTYIELFLNFRGKTPLKNEHFHPFFELRHSLVIRDPDFLVPFIFRSLSFRRNAVTEKSFSSVSSFLISENGAFTAVSQ